MCSTKPRTGSQPRAPGQLNPKDHQQQSEHTATPLCKEQNAHIGTSGVFHRAGGWGLDIRAIGDGFTRVLRGSAWFLGEGPSSRQ
jgi:hypothetical protein